MLIRHAHRSLVVQGLRDSAPIVIAYVPISITFGVVAVTSGVAWPLSLLMSVCIYAGASQFMLISLLAAGASPLSTAITLLLVNVRHFLYGTTLGPAFASWPETLKWLSAFGLTDEVYAVSYSRSLHQRPSPSYQFALVLSPYLSWIFGTVIGVFAGRVIPSSISTVLQFSLPSLFLALLFLSYRRWTELMAALCGAALAIGLEQFGIGGAGFIVGIVVGSTIGALCSRWHRSLAKQTRKL
ncbi:MAG: AzlC family ABC transporter permease [Alicyclobacillus sp.]|nr:AzlC family ABC transporter permease [Alicyclobacillus sp.]